MTDITIYEGDVLEVDYRIDNTGGESGSQDVLLLVDGTQEDADQGVVVGPGEITTGTLVWPTESGDQGTYPVVVETDDDIDSFGVEVGEPSLDVATVGVAEVGEETATLEGEVLELLGIDAADAQFEYRETGASAWQTTPALSLATPQTFEEAVSGLAADTQYEMRAVAQSTDPSGYSATGSTVQWTAEAAIPDSEANQKLDHRWYLSEDTAPFVDQIGNSDGTNNGTTQVTGNWVDGAARQGNGLDDDINIGTLGTFGSGLDTDWAVGLSFETTGSIGQLLGVIDSVNGIQWDFGFGVIGTDNDKLGFNVRGGNGNNVACQTQSTGFNDGQQYRVVFNKTGNNASDLNIWIDQTDIADEVTVDQGELGGVEDFGDDVRMFSRGSSNGGEGPYFGGDIDDVCIFGDSLTQTEIQSYQNPW